MKSPSRLLGALVLLGALAVTAPADADHAARLEAEKPGAPEGTAEPDAGQPPERITGRVLAVDAERGELLLATDAGMLELRGNPEDLVGVEVGDLIEVVMLEDSEDTLEADAPRI